MNCVERPFRGFGRWLADDATRPTRAAEPCDETYESESSNSESMGRISSTKSCASWN